MKRAFFVEKNKVLLTKQVCQVVLEIAFKSFKSHFI